MNYIFINNFSKRVIIFENRAKKLQFAYTDLFFLNDYPDCSIFYFSKEAKYLTQFENLCIKDWEDVFYSTQQIFGTPYLWFMTDDMTFEPTSDRNNAKESLLTKSDTHFFVDGVVNGGYKKFSFEEFCILLINSYFPSLEASNTDSSFIKDIENLKSVIISLNEKIEALPNKLQTILSENLETSYKSEIAIYRNDFYFKSVQRQGLDALIEVLENLYTQLYNSRNSGIDVQNAINYGIQLVERSLKNTFHIRFKSSNIGSAYDEQTMVSFSNESIQTDSIEMKNCVAKSISPAIYWTLPMVNSSEQEFLYKEENVILYV